LGTILRATGSDAPALGHENATWDVSRLRAACRCADCRRVRIDGAADPPVASLVLADARLVGDHALNIVFSDGHDRGIYPWSYLCELAEEAADRSGGSS
jgi:DUF971 family protein